MENKKAGKDPAKSSRFSHLIAIIDKNLDGASTFNAYPSGTIHSQREKTGFQTERNCELPTQLFNLYIYEIITIMSERQVNNYRACH